jgi:branched-chain amino acid transport system substrate-binding protein
MLVNLPAGMAAAFLQVVTESGEHSEQYKWISSTPLYDKDVPGFWATRGGT